MTVLTPLLLALFASDPVGESVAITARLDAAELAVGGTYELVVELTFEEQVSAEKAGMPAPMLQLDVPASVELTGEHLTTYEELAANEFLQMPFERMLTDGSARVAFTLKEEPGKDDTIGLIVTGYVGGSEQGPWFLRRRLELPLAPNAVARRGEDTDSSWGTDRKLLEIGQQAPVFALPRPDGGIVALDQFLGDRNIIVTTYRAFW